jgi:hypothetical protein
MDLTEIIHDDDDDGDDHDDHDHDNGINTYLLTPWSKVLLEKVTGMQLVKKFPVFYGTR